MRRVLVTTGLSYLCIAVIIGIYSVVTQPSGSQTTSFELIHDALQWPVTIFQ